MIFSFRLSPIHPFPFFSVTSTHHSRLFFKHPHTTSKHHWQLFSRKSLFAFNIHSKTHTHTHLVCISSLDAEIWLKMRAWLWNKWSGSSCLSSWNQDTGSPPFRAVPGARIGTSPEPCETLPSVTRVPAEETQPKHINNKGLFQRPDGPVLSWSFDRNNDGARIHKNASLPANDARTIPNNASLRASIHWISISYHFKLQFRWVVWRPPDPEISFLFIFLAESDRM